MKLPLSYALYLKAVQNMDLLFLWWEFTARILNKHDSAPYSWNKQ